MQATHQAHEDECSIEVMGRAYVVDLASMQQVEWLIFYPCITCLLSCYTVPVCQLFQKHCFVSIHMCIHTYIHTYVHTYIHTYICAYIDQWRLWYQPCCSTFHHQPSEDYQQGGEGREGWGERTLSTKALYSAFYDTLLAVPHIQEDARALALTADPSLGSRFVQTLFGALYEVFNSMVSA